MWLKLLILLLASSELKAQAQDPFHQRSLSKAKSLSVVKKYRYHGFLKINQQSFAILKMVGADYELLSSGLNKHLGQVIRIESSRICIRRKAKVYCLMRADSPKAWELLHE